MCPPKLSAWFNRNPERFTALARYFRSPIDTRWANCFVHPLRPIGTISLAQLERNPELLSDRGPH